MISPGVWWLSFICFLTLFGNVLVILAVYRDTSLHSATYYYIVSLALADLCVGVIVIPLAIFFELVQSSPYRYLCSLWHVMDVGASTASILALCVIALDRYIAITSPIRYPRSYISRHSSIVIAVIWFCSAIIAGPTVMVLGKRANSIESNFNRSNETVYDRCDFPSNPVFIVVSSSVSFYIPLIIMVFVYGRILIFARRQITALRQGYKQTTSGETYQLSPLVPRFCFRTLKKRNFTATPIENVNSPSNAPEKITLRIHRGKYSRSPSLAPIVPARNHVEQVSFPALCLRRLRKLRRTQILSRFSHEHKATKVLGIVMGVFIACWLPFFVFLVLTNVFHINFHNSQELLFRLFTWLGYTNSALNFFVYVLTSREFRLAFMKLLCPRRYIRQSLKQHACNKQAHRMDNGTTKSQQQTSSTNEYTGGDFATAASSEQRSDAYTQHQISTTVTTNRPAANNYGGGQTTTANGSNTAQPGGSTYKLKQQRNYGSNRYDPMGAQTTSFQARNAAQLQNQWNNGVQAAVAAAHSQYGAYANAFSIPPQYQQGADVYAGYYGAHQQAAYGPPGTQPALYGEYGQPVIPPESPKGGHVVYIYGIGQRATQEEIYALFQPYGRVLRVDIIIDFNTGLCKGYAFVAMEQYQEAQLAIQSLNATPFHGRQLQVRFKT